MAKPTTEDIVEALRFIAHVEQDGINIAMDTLVGGVAKETARVRCLREAIRRVEMHDKLVRRTRIVFESMGFKPTEGQYAECLLGVLELMDTEREGGGDAKTDE